DITVELQSLRRLIFIEHEDRTVGERAKARRHEHPVYLFAKYFDLNAPVITGHKRCAAHRGRDNERRISTKAIGFGKRPLHYRAQVLPPVTAFIYGAALDAHERLRGG